MAGRVLLAAVLALPIIALAWPGLDLAPAAALNAPITVPRWILW